MNVEKFFPELILTDEQIEKLHQTLLQMLVDVDFVCRKYNITYSLSGGSCLGAVRHKGFIPWDDDVDILIFGEDKKRLFDSVLQEFPDKYGIQDFSYNGAITSVSKIVLKGTKNVELTKENWPIEKNIFIDVFTFENTTPKICFRKLKAKKIQLLFGLMFANLNYIYKPSYMWKKSKAHKEVGKYLRLRRFVGFWVSWIKPSWFLKQIEKTCKVKKDDGLVCVPTSSYGYNSEVFKKEDFLETIDVEFEGKTFKIFKNYDMYLKNLYGDYMQIPPEEKRHRHLALELKFKEEE